MEHEHNRDVIAASVPGLQLLDRAQLHAALKPGMGKASFDNWLARSMRELGFPEPIRTGQRSCSWVLSEVQAWLASRPRKGRFDGKRHQAAA
jgi:predicted DNA-binding transcriptional regulator AlpA